jgi:hypothetical protein
LNYENALIQNFNAFLFHEKKIRIFLKAFYPLLSFHALFAH